eukprot:m.100167 g.100167  ORF g.100167 m.100167 type:complete len:135 (+) comp8922_c0_seq4:90-494(+)
MDLPSYAATESTALAQLPLATIAAALEDILRGNFATADVTVVDCPDLREPPFRLAAAGAAEERRDGHSLRQPPLQVSAALRVLQTLAASQISCQVLIAARSTICATLHARLASPTPFFWEQALARIVSPASTQS